MQPDKKYQVFGARVVVRRLQDEEAAEGRAQAALPTMLPPHTLPSADTGSQFSKGYVLSIGLRGSVAENDDVLNQSVIGEKNEWRDAAVEAMCEVVKSAMRSAQETMPAVAVGEVIVFATYMAGRLPGETDLFVVPGSAIVARVNTKDFGGAAGNA